MLPRPSFFILLSSLLSFVALSADASNPCTAFGGPDSQNRCREIVSTYEVSNAVVKYCSEFSRSQEQNFQCLRSGASIEAMNSCKSLGLLPENTLSCFRYSINLSLVKVCGESFQTEDGKLDCVRYGREIGQVQNCKNLFSSEDLRSQCLEFEFTGKELFQCRKQADDEDSRKACLSQTIAVREGREFRYPVRGLASPQKPQPATLK